MTYNRLSRIAIAIMILVLCVSVVSAEFATQTVGTCQGAVLASESLVVHNIVNNSHSFESSGFFTLTGNGQSQLALSTESGSTLTTKRVLDFAGIDGAGASLDESYAIAKMGIFPTTLSGAGLDNVSEMCPLEPIPEAGLPSGTVFNNFVTGRAVGVLYSGAYGSTSTLMVTPQEGSSVSFAAGVAGSSFTPDNPLANGIFTFSNSIAEQTGIEIINVTPVNTTTNITDDLGNVIGNVTTTTNVTTTNIELTGEQSYQKSVTMRGAFELSHTFIYTGV